MIPHVPATSAVTSPPLGVTVHMLVLLLTHALAVVMLAVELSLNVPVAVNCEVNPTGTELLPVTATLDSVATLVV